MTLEEEILHPYCLLRNELHLERLKKSVQSFGAIIAFQQAKMCVCFFFFFKPALKFARIYVYAKKKLKEFEF